MLAILKRLRKQSILSWAIQNRGELNKETTRDSISLYKSSKVRFHLAWLLYCHLRAVTGKKWKKDLKAGATFVLYSFMSSHVENVSGLLSNAEDYAASMTRRGRPDRKVHHLLQLVHKRTLLSWSPICRHHTDKVTIKRYWNKINGDGGGGRPRGCVCVLQERKKLCWSTHRNVHNTHALTHTHTHTPRSSHPSTGARPRGAPWRHERPENLIFPNTHQGSPSSRRDSAGDN